MRTYRASWRLTDDKNMGNQQRLEGRPFAVPNYVRNQLVRGQASYS